MSASIRQLLASARAGEKGPALAAIDAERLLCEALGKPRSYLFAWPDIVVASAPATRFADFVARRQQGEPLAYIVGQREFWSLPLEVNPATLIPRPETERLVECALAQLAPLRHPRVADLGTGSGAIALAIAHERPDCTIVACDQSHQALVCARRNAQRLGIKTIDWRQGDWFAPLAGEQFDMIVSNPPYVAADDPHLKALTHEPDSALVSGHDGLDALREISARAGDYLTSGGTLLVEHGYDQRRAVADLLRHSGWGEIQCWQDAAGIDRVSGARKP